MCGRDALFYTWAEIHALSQPLTLATPDADPLPVYNHAPTHSAWVLVAAQGAVDAVAQPMRWGLVPAWAADPKLAYSTINARVESASTKPAFRDAWRRRRCLVPASGYYEWQVLSDGRGKQPWFIHAARAPALMFAGLWEHWQRDGRELTTYCIVTQPAAGPITEVHDRMPLMLPSTLLRDWIHGSAQDAAAIAQAAPVPELAFHRVAARVGNVRNEGPELIRPLDTGADPES